MKTKLGYFIDGIIIVGLLGLIMLTSGCGSNGTMDITRLPVSDETVTAISGNITDASVQKELIVHQTLQNRDKMIKSSHSASGFKMKWVTVREEIQLPGQEAIVMTRSMPEVSYTEPAKFDQPLPVEPSQHPVWKFASGLVKDVKEGFLIYTGIKALDNILSGSIDAAQPKYYGTYNPQTAEPYIVKPEIVTPVIVQ